MKDNNVCFYFHLCIFKIAYAISRNNDFTKIVDILVYEMASITSKKRFVNLDNKDDFGLKISNQIMDKYFESCINIRKTKNSQKNSHISSQNQTLLFHLQ